MGERFPLPQFNTSPARRRPPVSAGHPGVQAEANCPETRLESVGHGGDCNNT